MYRMKFKPLLFIIFTLSNTKGGVIKNPELGPFLEGDILPSPASDGLANPQLKWTNGIVYYKYDEDYPDVGIYQVERAIKEFHKYTCIRFKEAQDTDNNYILFVDKKRLCASQVGMGGGGQQVILSINCIQYLGTVIHEIMHALGVYHEQSRRDRDNYVNILWDNIQPNMSLNFRLPNEETLSYGVPYNPHSVMHYGLTAFSLDGEINTMEIKNKSINLKLVGQRINFAASDLLKVNRMYNCTIPDDIDLDKND